jgi:hypothetical protein
MYPQTHFLFSYLVGLVFAKLGFFDYKIALFVGLAGLLVDVDHFIVFVLKYKEMNFKHAWNKAVKGLYAGRSFVHHQFGFLGMTLLVAILFYYNRTWFWIIGLGYYTHMFLDYAHLNFLKIRGRIVFKEFGIVERINKFEVLLDLFLIFGIVLLLL